MRLKPLIKKVCTMTEAAYFLEGKGEGGFIREPSKQKFGSKVEA